MLIVFTDREGLARCLRDARWRRDLKHLLYLAMIAQGRMRPWRGLRR
jgi:hypothetical protein